VLSDRDWEALREVERRLSSEDPGFARSFEARAQRLPRTSTGGAGIRIFLIAGLLLSALVAVAGSLGGAAAFATATGLVWLVWRFARETDQQSP
jgi:Flp pilus assembly protein TadB